MAWVNAFRTFLQPRWHNVARIRVIKFLETGHSEIERGYTYRVIDSVVSELDREQY